ncbi:aminopeptidase P family protein [Candidatus Woesearchaeota archaeon]|nr:aminopeptidase P family protein [Candidatus Woesearchaeota archaeon]
MKIKEFQNYLKEKNIDLALFFNNEKIRDSSFCYFTQIPSSADINGILVIPSSKAPHLLVSILELNIAKKYSIIKDVRELKSLKEIKEKTIGLNYNCITLTRLKNIKKEIKSKFIDISEKVSELRTLKTKNEIKLLKESCLIASSIMKKAIDFCNKDKTEIEVKYFIENEIKKLNLESSFTPIVASNNNSKNSHHISENKKLKGFTIIDLGVNYKNYCSDITRTIYIGSPSKKEIEDYNKVLKIQEESIKCKEVKASKLFLKAKKILGKDFIHSLGHGIGIDIHELPNLSEKSKEKITSNMIYTVEPGIYNKYGIRIEDVILNKEVLTKVNKEIVISS